MRVVDGLDIYVCMCVCVCVCVFFRRIYSLLVDLNDLAQSAGAVEYTYCTCAEE